MQTYFLFTLVIILLLVIEIISIFRKIQRDIDEIKYQLYLIKETTKNKANDEVPTQRSNPSECLSGEYYDALHRNPNSDEKV